jgi:uncharacterized protein
MFAGHPARAQSDCDYGSDQAFDGLMKTLQTEKTCGAAAAKLNACAWGSSADAEFAPVVIQKCEKTFFNGLSAAGRKNYGDAMQMCAYEYAKQEGTIAISEAALCQVDVATRYAAHPAIAAQPEPRASFDCGVAHSILEKAICSDIRVGHADIVLSRVYPGLLKSPDATEKDRLTLVQSEKNWLQSVPTSCHLAEPFSDVSLNCVRSTFEDRFTLLDSCAGPMSDCLASIPEDSTPTDDAPRASFDCEKPATALEIVICADADLGQTDILLAQAYHDAGTEIGSAQHGEFVASERGWLRFVDRTCPLGAGGGIPPLLTRSCIRTAFETRIQQLQTCPKQPTEERISCLSHFDLMGPRE